YLLGTNYSIFVISQSSFTRWVNPLFSSSSGIDAHPWEILKNKYPVGSVVDAKIVSFASFGAFANILPTIDGLIHISQISWDRIKTPQDVLKIGDVVKAKIIDIDFDKKRVSLSIKELLDKPEETIDELSDDSATDEEAAEEE
ncbi:MAG: S1 RNA-binding domain-containing protein, partial [Clostridiales bacterium]|nr:S1 RNA-binding domain-containing protein [Clostridiales bacterium]